MKLLILYAQYLHYRYLISRACHKGATRAHLT